MNDSLHTLDVRPILKAGGEPFAEIMKAAATLENGQGLRLLATFKPVPLFSVMQGKGYSHTEKEIGGGDWEIIFLPLGAAAPESAVSVPKKADVSDTANWPAAGQIIDLRGMMPPEPLILTLETVEDMAPGEVVEACYDRDPLLLYPELDVRGHRYHCEKYGANEYRVRIRRATPGEGAA
ncbi:MAG: DUF2249 domain-containing protein [Proteobacteria bacterium]|nr:DUF2249 domain-containing protein [Pseudomonadota bacterium]HQR03220.1 DUF2249 domain-containing protein [Rhodocyclaceae bacterium]